MVTAQMDHQGASKRFDRSGLGSQKLPRDLVFREFRLSRLSLILRR
jgi:hypothetical protein